jgi:ABC-2 type transport system ATP-binding protein
VIIRRVLVVVLAAVLVVLQVPYASAKDQAVVEFAYRLDATPEPDKTPVSLDVTLMTTNPAQAQPAIVLAHGFGGTKADSAGPARTLARHGYTVITYTARGFGASGGKIHLDNPSYEGADTRMLVDFAATRPEVAKTGDDPVIGFAGASYGGAASLLAAGLDRRVDAIVPAFTWNSLTQALVPQYAVTGSQRTLADVPSASSDAGVFKKQWTALFFRSGTADPSADGEPNPLCGRFDTQLCELYLTAAQTGRPDHAFIAELAKSNLSMLVSQITAPTLIIAGEQDTLFPLDQADANFRALPASTPAAMDWVQGGHDADISVDDLMPQLEAWFDRYLKKDGTTAASGFSVVVPQTGLIGRGDQGVRDPAAYIARSYPGRGSDLATQSLPVNGQTQTIVSPPGATPASLTSLPGTGNALSQASSIGGYALSVLPGQSATFTTAPLADPVMLVGSGRIRLSVTSTTPAATLFASLWDLGPDISSTPGNGAPTRSAPGTAVLPGLAVSPVRLTGLTPGQAVSVEVALPPVSHQVPVGHRLQLVVSSTDQAYAVPTTAAVYTIGLLATSTLTLPKLTATQVGAGQLDVPLPLVIGVAALVLAAIVAMVVFWLRRRIAHPREDLRDMPLVVDGLVKTYRGGIKAVAGVSFSAAPGQVVGLLGPNGAGKTTVMRMLVGLIRPDAGSVYVSGEPVHAGADVLGSVGAFIEGPGFLPHLTGLENLNAFWGATGRPREEAHLDEALAIAGLGNAVNRRVRGYSQGMRQRLGIAQAMLGLPELLLLDEPTNGLDPPQIKAMRGVLHDYAATGRTVVVSSHLLSEVQQTCTHVVVMHLGKVILTGSMAQLTATDDVTLVGLAEGSDPAAAEIALEDLEVTTTADGLMIRVTGDVPRPQIIAHLVGAGAAIDSVDGHRQLEEVFMSLVGPPPDSAGAGSTGAPNAPAGRLP